MLKHLIKFGGILLLFFLVACSGAQDTAVPVTAPEQVEESQQPEQVPQEPVEETTTEEELLPVAAKPQFIEFYADW